MRSAIHPLAALIVVVILSAFSLAGSSPRAGAAAAWQRAPSAAAAMASPSTVLVGDVNGDCHVNLSDLILEARHYLAEPGSLLYSAVYDLNRDGVISIADIQIVAAHFGQHC